MTKEADAQASALEAVHALERHLAERGPGTSTLDAALATAREQADRIRALARTGGEEAARARRQAVHEEVDREAARIRAEGERRSVELREAMAAMLVQTVDALLPIVLPAIGEHQCSSR